MPATLSSILNNAPFPLYIKDKANKTRIHQQINITRLELESTTDTNYCLIQITDVTAARMREKVLETQIKERTKIEQRLLKRTHQLQSALCVSNAVKFSPAGGVIKIEIDRGLKWLDGKEQAVLELVLKDQGVGIPVDELDVVFDKFIQSSKTKSKAGGTGLGLPICKEIISLHEGRIWAESPVEDENLTPESEISAGTAFHLMIPAIQTVAA